MGLAHLSVMDAATSTALDPDRSSLRLIEQLRSLCELYAQLRANAQTIYDLRSQGRGPRGLRSVENSAFALARAIPNPSGGTR